MRFNKKLGRIENTRGVVSVVEKGLVSIGEEAGLDLDDDEDCTTLDVSSEVHIISLDTFTTFVLSFSISFSVVNAPAVMIFILPFLYDDDEERGVA